MVVHRDVPYGPLMTISVITAANLMTRRKKKLTPEQKAEMKKRREEYMTVFMNGKQKRVKRPRTIDGIPVEEFILRTAGPIWLHRNKMWEYIDQNENKGDTFLDDGEVPFSSNDNQRLQSDLASLVR